MTKRFNRYGKSSTNGVYVLYHPRNRRHNRWYVDTVALRSYRIRTVSYLKWLIMN